MNYFEYLPIELVYVIAQDSEPVYKALICAYPRFAREVTPGPRIDFMIHFGHEICVSKDKIEWLRGGLRHNLVSPSVKTFNVYRKYNTQELLGCAVHTEYVQEREDYLLCRCPRICECQYVFGDNFWFRDGKLHREEGPAVEYASGDKQWYRNGQLHREDGSAIEYCDGHKEWYWEGNFVGENAVYFS